MQWQEQNTVLDISEVTVDNTISISMYDSDDPNNGFFIAMAKHDVVRMIEWLTKSLADIKD